MDRVSASGRDPVERLADEFLARYRQGERPTIDEYVARSPELADEIREVFPALLELETLGSVAGANLTTAIKPTRREDVPSLKQVGEFRILREIGRGGMGIVYEAVQESLGRHVALKVMPFHGRINPTQLERFRLEARSAARLHHTNIVPVYGVGEEKGVHYYAMQFIQGQGLDAILEELKILRDGRPGHSMTSTARATGSDNTVTMACSLMSGQFPAGADTPQPRPAGRSEQTVASTLADTQAATVSGPSAATAPALSPSRPVPTPASSDRSELTTHSDNQYFRSVARVGLQVAEALAYAHQQGILHRDIKPSNLLLDIRGIIWITDFGLAKADEGETLTQTGDIVGTLRYMAPERFEGWSDPRSDLYALGVTLYELLTLRPLYEETNRARLIERVIHDNPPVPRKIDRHIPRDLETIVLKATAKEPSARYMSAEAMADDLRNYLSDKPIRARRASFPERTWRWCRRNPVPASLLVALLLVFLGGFAAVTQQWLRAERQRQLAEFSFHQARGAVEDYLTKVSESKLLSVAGMQPLRKELLESALIYYQEFVSQRGDDPELQQDLATALMRVGRITGQIGNKNEALRAYGKAYQILLRLQAADPESAERRRTLAHYHEDVGDLEYQLSDPEAALKSYRRAQEIWSDLRTSKASDLEARNGLASCLNKVGTVLDESGDPEKALTAFNEALSALQDSGAGSPRPAEQAKSLFLVAKQYRRIGDIESEISLYPQALRSYGQALDTFRDMNRGHPLGVTLEDLRRELAGTLESTGDVRSKARQTAEAIGSYREALPIREELARTNPAVLDFKADLAKTYDNLGRLQIQARQWDQGLASFRRAIERQQAILDAAPDDPRQIRLLGGLYARQGDCMRELGRAPGALEAYREALEGLSRVQAPTAEDLYNLAVVRAAIAAVIGSTKGDLPSEQKQERQRAVERSLNDLARAVAAGFADIDRVKAEKALEPLRGDPRYADLMKKLAANSKTLEWFDDLEPAMARAQAEKKDLFIYFSGSDWCTWCLVLKKSVFAKPGFVSYAPQHFQLVELDTPMHKPKPKNYARTKELFQQWGLEGFPTMVLADSKGKPYAIILNDASDEARARYIENLDSLRKIRIERDEWLARAESAQGIEKARCLDKALGPIHKNLYKSDYGDVIAQIIALDPRDQAHLKSKYAGVEVARRRPAVETAMKEQKWSEALSQLNSIFEQVQPIGEVEQDLLLLRAEVHGKLGDQPHADADVSRAIKLAQQTVDERRKDFENNSRNPQSRRTLSQAYERLCLVQRKARRPADAVTTAIARRKLWENDPIELYNAACELALCMPLLAGEDAGGSPAQEKELRRVGDLALEALGKSVASGFREVEHIMQDSDLNALRSRKEFQDVIKGLQNEHLVLLSRMVEAQPNDAGRRYRRGYFEALWGRWDEAKRDFEKATEMGIPDLEAWLAHALLCLKRGDTAAYRKVCAEVLTRFGQTDSPSQANGVAWIFAVGPSLEEDSTLPVQLAEKAVASDVRNATVINTLGAVLYRAGRYEEAIRRLHDSIDAQGKGGEVEDWLFLAMAHHRLHQEAEAQQWLEKASRFVSSAALAEANASSSAATTRVRTRDWTNVLTQKLLFQEMQTLIAGKTSASLR